MIRMVLADGQIKDEDLLRTEMYFIVKFGRAVKPVCQQLWIRVLDFVFIFRFQFSGDRLLCNVSDQHRRSYIIFTSFLFSGPPQTWSGRRWIKDGHPRSSPKGVIIRYNFPPSLIKQLQDRRTIWCPINMLSEGKSLPDNLLKKDFTSETIIVVIGIAWPLYAIMLLNL